MGSGRLKQLHRKAGDTAKEQYFIAELQTRTFGFRGWCSYKKQEKTVNLYYIKNQVLKVSILPLYKW